MLIENSGGSSASSGGTNRTTGQASVWQSPTAWCKLGGWSWVEQRTLVHMRETGDEETGERSAKSPTVKALKEHKQALSA